MLLLWVLLRVVLMSTKVTGLFIYMHVRAAIVHIELNHTLSLLLVRHYTVNVIYVYFEIGLQYS